MTAYNHAIKSSVETIDERTPLLVHQNGQDITTAGNGLLTNKQPAQATVDVSGDEASSNEENGDGSAVSIRSIFPVLLMGML